MKQTKLKNLLQDKGVSPHRLAMECKIAPSTMYSILNGKICAYPRYRKSISEYLGLPEEDIFIDEEGER